MSTLLGLLSHDNTDVAVAAVEVLQELTDVDTLQESEEGAEALLGSLLDNQVCSLMVTNMERLDETVKEEAEGVHNTLAIVENLVELKPEICKDVAEVRPNTNQETSLTPHCAGGLHELAGQEIEGQSSV